VLQYSLCSFVADLPFLERRRRFKGDVRKVPELSLRLRERWGRPFHTHPGGVQQASLVIAKLFYRGKKAVEMEGARLTEDVGEARAGP